MTRYDTSLTPQRAAMSTAASIATPRVSLRIRSGARALGSLATLLGGDVGRRLQALLRRARL